jgi:hypothetical protein
VPIPTRLRDEEVDPTERARRITRRAGGGNRRARDRAQTPNRGRNPTRRRAGGEGIIGRARRGLAGFLRRLAN